MEYDENAKKRAKICLYNMIKENKCYDRLYELVFDTVKETVMSDDYHTKHNITYKRLSKYYENEDNLIATGLVMDLLKSLGLQKTITAFQTELAGASYYDREILLTILNIDDCPKEPLLLHLFQQDSNSLSSSKSVSHTDDDSDKYKMKSTETIHNSFNDQYGNENSADIFSHVN